MNSIQQLVEDIESIKNILMARATGERADENKSWEVARLSSKVWELCRIVTAMRMEREQQVFALLHGMRSWR